VIPVSPQEYRAIADLSRGWFPLALTGKRVDFILMIIYRRAGVTSTFSAPITLELSGGSVIKGDLVSWNGEQAVVKAEFGPVTFRRDQLNQATIQRLELLSGDPQKLLARISELEATVENLRKDNAALRQQLQIATTTQSVSPAPATSREVTPHANSFSRLAWHLS